MKIEGSRNRISRNDATSLIFFTYWAGRPMTEDLSVADHA